MFVEKLNMEQIKMITRKIMEEEKMLSIYSEKDMYGYCDNKNDPCVHMIFGKKGRLEYVLNLSDTYLSCSAFTIDNIEYLSKICIKELYKIFGEEYKEYYMQQANSIFE